MFMTLYARTHSPTKKIPGGGTDRHQPLHHCVASYILPDIYLQHFAKLSEATYILLGDCITAHALGGANMLLDEFYTEFEAMYGGGGSCGLNVHNADRCGRVSWEQNLATAFVEFHKLLPFDRNMDPVPFSIAKTGRTWQKKPSPP